MDYPQSVSIGDKVVTLTDQAAPYIISGSQPTSIIWSSDGNGGANFTTILGIDETSTTAVPSPTAPPYPVGTPAFIPCNGSSDGACDTSNIVSYYNFNRTSGGNAPTPLSDYAAGLCESSPIDGYTDWYLPAICEMDAVTVTAGLICPSMQSMVGSLSFLIGDFTVVTPSTSCNPPAGTDCLAGYYWSSTEYSTSPQISSWYEAFFNGGSSQNPGSPKSTPLGARCSRALTP